MLEIKKIRENKTHIIKAMEARNITDAAALVDQLVILDENRRSSLTSLEQNRAEMNKVSKSIGSLMQAGKREEAEQAKSQTASIKADIKTLEQDVSDIQNKIRDILYTLPNANHVSVPVGHSEEDNLIVSEHGEGVKFDFDPTPHWELVDTLGIISFDLGAKITGAGFPVYLGKGARLQRALIAFFLDEAREAGYLEVMPPLLVNEASGYGTGQLPDKEGQMYYVNMDDLYLIPTAEVPITNLFRDVILDEKELPTKRCGYTACFRREAGAYGSHVRGLNRLHQFDKVELVQVAHPDKSYELLEEMTSHVCDLLDKLQLQYRKLLLCTGDTGFTAAKTYDLEVYSAAQSRWLEVSSISNFESFQANRLQLRFRDENNKKQLAHTLNGSALALPRILAALIENNQQADGSIVIPEVLRSYTGFDKIG